MQSRKLPDLDLKMRVGEKIETIIFTRNSGGFGEYLGSTDTIFGIAKVDNIVYEVERNIEANAPWFWRVTNTNTGKIVELLRLYDLAGFKEV